MEFGSILRKMRKSAGLSQEDMAHELHMSISNISRLETGKYELKAVDLLNWVNVTGSQEVLAAMVLGVDVGMLQHALDLISTMAVGFIGGIINGFF